LVIPAKVQGEGAADEIAQGVAIAGTIQPPLDVLIVGRGGGSIEDLWAFNEEVVVRAVAASPIPTVSAVGHEIDVTLCDLAADVRALTPSEAAERVVPHRDEILEAIQAAQTRVTMLVSHRIREQQARLESIGSRPVLVQPERMLDTAVQRLDELERRCEEAMSRSMESCMHRFEMTASRIEALSPLKTLARGYSLTMLSTSTQVVRSANDVQPGDTLITQLAEGTLTSTVTKSIGSKNGPVANDASEA
jgi:exodeoxyribonuclease VII large subunit